MKDQKQRNPVAEKLILALDVDTLEQAKHLVDLLASDIKIFKVGIHLFTACGTSIIEYIRGKGAEVFLDLKFFDIPNTVASAMKQVVKLQVKMCTLHILGDEEMLKGAKIAAQEEAIRLDVARPLLIGVTVLTSKETTSDDVLILARLGIDSGLDGIVCSAREVAFLKKEINKKFIAVTPGIRPPRFASADQKRTATVEEAIANGSDFLVIGRPIIEAADPRAVVREILAVGA